MTEARSPMSRLYLVAACFTLAGFFLNSSAMLFDDRLFNGEGIWVKPLKFWLSTSLHFATLGLLLPLASMASQKSKLTLVVVFSCIIAGLYETFYIAGQAARGTASHFNRDTALELNLYYLMGVGAILLVVASFVLGIQICRSGKPWTGLRWGAALGLIIGSVLTLITAGFMSTQPSHFMGTALSAASDANGIPVIGWSLTLPDLRPPHFVATHIMQALPVVGLLADKFIPSRAKLIVIVSAVAGMLLVAGLFARAVTL